MPKVEVDSEDLAILKEYRNYPRRWVGESITSEDWDSDMEAIDRLIAAIPGPEWNPTEDQVFAYMKLVECPMSEYCFLCEAHLRAAHQALEVVK